MFFKLKLLINIDDFHYFKKKIKSYIKKNNHFFDIIKSNSLLGITIYNLIYIEKILKYEILFKYVNNKYCKLGCIILN